MNHITVTSIQVPQENSLFSNIDNAYYHDSHLIQLDDSGRSALAIYLDMISKTPAWVNGLMVLRNRLVSLFGLKDVG